MVMMKDWDGRNRAQYEHWYNPQVDGEPQNVKSMLDETLQVGDHTEIIGTDGTRTGCVVTRLTEDEIEVRAYCSPYTVYAQRSRLGEQYMQDRMSKAAGVR